MLRDKDSDVSAKISKTIVQIERTDAITDLESTILNEKNSESKKRMIRNLSIINRTIQNLIYKHDKI